ncbi:MAG: ATP-dependent metallopeptidase FtsH/Yme1/Tma family protein [Sphaerobacteraceae bacterium]|nr:MAG: ATP-dependent metallopeptidase FtsH/Yme1/Tma family protein [Sphaerobacteraceae bacterium]
MNNRDDQSSRQKKSGGEEGEQKTRPSFPIWILWALLISLFAYSAYAYFWPSGDPTISISYSELRQQVEAGNVSQITMESEDVSGEFAMEMQEYEGQIYTPEDSLPSGAESDDITQSVYFESAVPENTQPDFVAFATENNVSVTAEPSSDGMFGSLLFLAIPLLLFIVILFFIGRSMSRGQQNVFSFGKSKAKQYDPERPKLTFADVAGEEESKAELEELVQYLKDPAKFHNIGARLPRGILLVGPPGTGKTLLAKAVAGEANVPFFSVSASEFVEMFVGVGASRVRDLFEKAKTNSPAIIFVDELDAVGRQRFAGVGGGNDEREQTLNQLLVEMDGFDPHEDVIVVAATNRPDVLDPALLRPGRFDRQVTVGLPDKRGREAILKIHTRGIPVDENLDLGLIASATPGFAGADLANLVNEAALMAARRDKKIVQKDDFDLALDKIILGTERSMVMNEHEKRVVAYHEGGHAICAHFSPGADPLRKVTIVPRGRALGVTIQAPEEDRFNYSRSYLLGRLVVIMGGRAAERMVFNEITTGAQNDLKEATMLARRMVGLWGMSEEIGPIFLGMGEQHVFLGREMGQDREVGEKTVDRADEAVQKILYDAMDQAETLLRNHRDKLDSLADKLIEDETVDRDGLFELLGPHAVFADEGESTAVADMSRTDGEGPNTGS